MISEREIIHTSHGVTVAVYDDERAIRVRVYKREELRGKSAIRKALMWFGFVGCHCGNDCCGRWHYRPVRILRGRKVIVFRQYGSVNI